MAYDDFLFPFYLREELEGRAGGNPSFNTGVDYTKQLKSSANYGEVVALYQAAGLNLDGDLATLNATTRIAADPGALTYLTKNIIFNGQLSVPVLTLHTTGDGLVPVEVAKAHSTVVREAVNKTLLPETFVHRAGHCEFTPAETITALRTLELRLTTGKWRDLGAWQLNNEADELGPAYHVLDINNTSLYTPPEFLTYQPLLFLRVYDAFTK